MRNDVEKKSGRNRLRAAVLAAGAAGLAFSGGVMTSTLPVFADPVTVEAPAQNFGFADVVSRVSPAVVSVRVTENVDTNMSDGSDFDNPFGNLPPDHPLRRFFQFGNPDMPNGGQRPSRPHKAMAQGSGFFISDDGYLVTNNHVVEDGSDFTVVLDDGTELKAKLIGADKRTDLAVLKVDPNGRKFTYVEFGDDSKVRVGDWVVAVGNPFGLGGSVTAGIISARGRDIGAGPYDDFLQIDAAVNRGNSGGPAFDLQGKVIGVNTAIFSPSGGNVGIAFAIPATVAKSVVQSLREHGNVERGWLGVQISAVTKDIAEAVGLAEPKGAIVTMPDSDTPATEAGIQTGDVITAVNGQTVDGPRELSRTIAAFRPGTKVDITIWRNDKSKTVSVTLGDLATLDKETNAGTDNAPSRPGAATSSLSGYGLTITPSDDGEGLVITDVDPSSAAADKGIETGDVIVSINGNDVKSQGDVDKALKSANDAGRKAALFQLRTNGQNRFVALPLSKG
ncbi:Do family serine endopeptidase [Consotaella salsifontis]|uniref:Probable periplasmic serine endoprotease DegP-like n=1 Tax=Consotaella salsifontis TaxID=1365950 RepID=A0A1T4SW99_9HYPH|nr:Do family serine endopeptidase [Consotaella salsifontis]SKA32540.1 serine protease Do [Consotaella salsifontis]